MGSEVGIMNWRRPQEIFNCGRSNWHTPMLYFEKYRARMLSAPGYIGVLYFL